MEELEVYDILESEGSGTSIELKAIVEFEGQEYDISVNGIAYYTIAADGGDRWTPPTSEITDLEFEFTFEVYQGDRQIALFNTPFHENDKMVENLLKKYCIID